MMNEDQDESGDTVDAEPNEKEIRAAMFVLIVVVLIACLVILLSTA